VGANIDGVGRARESDHLAADVGTVELQQWIEARIASRLVECRTSADVDACAGGALAVFNANVHRRRWLPFNKFDTRGGDLHSGALTCPAAAAAAPDAAAPAAAAAAAARSDARDGSDDVRELVGDRSGACGCSVRFGH